jgi:hypothetical protein
MMETRNATQSNLIDDQRVQDLPMNGRNVAALAGAYAGVTSIRANQDAFGRITGAGDARVIQIAAKIIW